MNLLATQVPALVYPYSRQQEQPLRADKIKNFLPMKILSDEDLSPDRLSDSFAKMLDQKRTLRTLPIDMNGAVNSAEFLSRMVNHEIPCSKVQISNKFQ
jgi:predicted glycosyltransferase